MICPLIAVEEGRGVTPAAGAAGASLCSVGNAAGENWRSPAPSWRLRRSHGAVAAQMPRVLGQ